MKADVVFQGGGIKAIGFIGAVSRLEEKGITYENLAGTSAGAVIASLLSVGYSGKDLKKIMENIEYSKFTQKKVIAGIPLAGKFISLFIEKGLYGTDYLEEYLSKLYSLKGKTKFKDVSENGKSRLKIIASDVTRKKLLVLPDDLIYYGIEPMEFEIAKAVIMSISIPLFFVPVKISHHGMESFIVDGGILSNFPIWIFDVKGIPRWPTIGFKFESTEKKKLNNNQSFFSYAIDIVESIIDNYDEAYIQDKDRVRTIEIPTLGTKTTDFKISKLKSNELFKEGYNSADKFLKSWNFSEYIKKYR